MNSNAGEPQRLHYWLDGDFNPPYQQSLAALLKQNPVTVPRILHQLPGQADSTFRMHLDRNCLCVHSLIWIDAT